MLLLLGQLVSFIPGLTSLGTSWINASYNAKVDEIVAKTGASRDVALGVIQMQQAVQTRWWFVAAIPPMFAMAFVVYVWKAVVWDNVIMAGATSTPALNGTLGTVFIMVVAFYFAHGMSKS